MKNKYNLKPESLMMSYGYDPKLSEGAIKCPIFQTSTFVFNTAEEGKAYFELAYGLREKKENEEMGLIYSRLNNPDLEILENRLCLWDGADDCAVFESGMSAISTCLLEFLNPGDLLLYSMPVYGGTDHFIKHVLTRFGINVLAFKPGDNKEAIIAKLDGSGLSDKLAMIYVETPANPTNDLIDISVCKDVADYFSTEDKPVKLAVDNTYMGPLWQHPMKQGADFVLYSATKYIGGHSDVIAGACLGSADDMQRIKGLRTFLGNMANPNTGWLLMRSLETLKPRMEIQTKNAVKVANFLSNHDKVGKVLFLGLLDENSPEQFEIYKKQCLSPGAMLSFEINGGEHEAFQFMNALKMIKMAVSLGSTESLVQHPAAMTHAGVDPQERLELGITENLVRLSVGIEDTDDIIWDLGQALEYVGK